MIGNKSCGINAEKSDAPVLKDTGAGFSVFYHGRFLYSRKFPAKIPEEAAAGLEILPGTLVLAFSPLLGYGLQTLVNKLPKDSLVLAVECDETLFNFSAPFVEKAVSPADKKPFKFFFAKTPEVLIRFIDEELFANFKPFRRYLRIDLSASASLDAQFYRSAEALVADYISSFWKNRATLIHLGRKYAENIFKNLGEIAAGNALGFSFENAELKPIIVVGAGPSLDSAIGFIKRNRDRVFLIAVDAALLPLRAAGITADLAVTVEAQAWIDRAFCGCAPGKGFSPYLLADITSRPQERGSGRRCSFFLTLYAKSRFLSRLSRSGITSFEAQALGSVGLSALYVAGLLRGHNSHARGRLPHIFFTGLDFSWGSGFSHAKGAAQVLELLSSSCRISPVETKRAENSAGSKIILQRQAGRAPIRTSEAMLRYAAICQAYFSHASFYRLGTQGLPVDFPSISIDAAETEIASFSKSSAASAEIDFECSSKLQEAALSFLKNEERRLLELKALLSSGGELCSDRGTRLEELLREADFLYLHFPDFTSERGTDVLRQDFLNRARVELDFFLKTLQVALRQAGK